MNADRVPAFATNNQVVTSRIAIHVHGMVRALILNPAFPCHLGRSAVSTGNYRFGLYRDMSDPKSILGLARDLYTYTVDRKTVFLNKFATFIVSFENPRGLDEKGFEDEIWKLLQQIHDLDKSAWNSTVSADPDDPKFAFSFAGDAFFVVGMHSQSSRYSRTFPWPTLVFNAQDQFDTLRNRGQFQKAQEIIRKNDMLLQATINPSLTNFGDDSAAKQFSGRLVENDWKCPFRPKDS
jgi:FPC/CPF motif-containing protein YcgG